MSTQSTTDNPPVKKSARKPLKILGAIIGVVILGICIYALVNANREETDDAQVESDVVPLGARVAGQVTHVRVIDNQLVKKGETILEIDPVDYLARVKQAEAELATAQAQALASDAQAQVVEASAKGGFSSAKAGVSGSSSAVANAEAQIAAAKAALARAVAEARKATLDLKRSKELFTARAIPQERLDNSQASYDSNQAALEAAQAQVNAAGDQKQAAQSRVLEAKGRLDQSSPIEAQIAVARANAQLGHARVQSSEAQLELARNQLSYTQVVAPTDGFVSRLAAHEGQLIQIGQPLAELVPAATYVVANFKETQLGRFKIGQRVKISLDAFPERSFEAKVESLSGGTGARFSLLPPDNASGNFVKVVQRVPVRMAWENLPNDVSLRAGLSADVTVYLK